MVSQAGRNVRDWIFKNVACCLAKQKVIKLFLHCNEINVNPNKMKFSLSQLDPFSAGISST